jgi:hypothetical protein
VAGDLDTEDIYIAPPGGAATVLGEVFETTAGSTIDCSRRVFLPAFPLSSPARPESRGR